MTYRLTLLALTVALVGGGCARNLKPAQSPTAPDRIHELWSAPDAGETRDLFWGAGGRDFDPPNEVYRFVAVKTSGKNPGFDVRDAEGRLWAVKLGEEAQTEVVVSRILWAIGFHQPPTYYVPQWQISGHAQRDQPAGRFRAELPEHEVAGEWSWYDNPFIGTRPYAALIATSLLLNNWDLKTSNNKIYLAKNAAGTTERRYVVRDLGGSLGRAYQRRLLRWVPFMRHLQGTKSRLDHFEQQPFINGVEGGKVDFNYRGLDEALARSVTLADLLWTRELLLQLTEHQWMDAFRAGGYTAEEQTRYVRRIRAKLDEIPATAAAAP